MEFQGKSYNITDSEGNMVKELGKGHGRVLRDILTGYRCYVMRAWIKFKRKSE